MKAARWVPSWRRKKECASLWKKLSIYRGDVTLTLKDNSKIEGYLFDRMTGSSLTTVLCGFCPKIPAKSEDAYAESGTCFTGRDNAAGKSWEAWVGKVLGKEASGEGD